jgi:hypothetical protein
METIRKKAELKKDLTQDIEEQELRTAKMVNLAVKWNKGTRQSEHDTQGRS